MVMKKRKRIKKKKDAAGTLMDMMTGKRGETSDDKEELAWNRLDDDNNCKAAAKPTNNIIEHDKNCVVDANKGEKEGVDFNNEGKKEVDKEFDIDSLYNKVQEGVGVEQT